MTRGSRSFLGRAPDLLGGRVLRGALHEHSWSCRRFSGGIYLRYGESCLYLILPLLRNLPLAPFVIPTLGVAQRCTLMDYSAALREAGNCDQGCCSLRGSRAGAHRAAGHSKVGREPLCSIWGRLGCNPPSQVTLRRWRNSSGPSVRPVLPVQRWLQLESLVLLEGWFFPVWVGSF